MVFRLFTIHRVLTKFKKDSFFFKKRENKITLNFNNNEIHFLSGFVLLIQVPRLINRECYTQ